MSLPHTTLAAWSGQVVRIGLQFRRGDGSYEPMAGRAFAWALLDATGATVATATGAVSVFEDAPTSFMAFDGPTTAALLEGRGEAARFTGQVVEVTAGGVRPHAAVHLRLTRGAADADLPDAGSGGLPTEIITLVSE